MTNLPSEPLIDKLMGRALRNHRNKSGLSMQKLALEVDVSFQQIQKYEQGVNRISVSRLFRLCEVLQIPPTAIIAEVEGELARNSRKDCDETQARMQYIQSRIGHTDVGEGAIFALASIDDKEMRDAVVNLVLTLDQGAHFA